MRNTIAVMNTKGGVGKSTLVLALAETLSAKFGKNVLVIDSDSQASVSLMLLSIGNLNRLQLDSLTIVDLLVAIAIKKVEADWTRCVVSNVSDVDEARSVYLIPSDMQLTLFEREISKEGLIGRLRKGVSTLIADVSAAFDVVLIDCPPGLSVLTETWLREVHFHISPITPHPISPYALEVFEYFKNLNPEMGFAENLGVLINMRDQHSTAEGTCERRLMEDLKNYCFPQVVPRTSVLQQASQVSQLRRSYDSKYPGASGVVLRNLCHELLSRLTAANSGSSLLSRLSEVAAE